MYIDQNSVLCFFMVLVIQLRATHLNLVHRWVEFGPMHLKPVLDYLGTSNQRISPNRPS